MSFGLMDADCLAPKIFNTHEMAGALGKLGCTIEPCGSRVTCNPAPLNTDADYLVVAPPLKMQIVSDLVCLLGEHKFTWEGSEHYQDAAASGFMSWRRDDVNLIVTADQQFAARHRAATALCKRLNLLSKPDRVAVFQAVLYSNAAI